MPIYPKAIHNRLMRILAATFTASSLEPDAHAGAEVCG
jgi:hypothetical protein